MPVHPDLIKLAQNGDSDAVKLMMKWGYEGSKKFIGGNPVEKIIQSPRDISEILATDLNACNNWEEGLAACSKVLCPTLLLLGSNDKMTPPKGTKIMSETLRESTTITLPNAGHMMMVEQPEQTLDALISFFEN